jgi:RNA polymerase sigma factor (sigma-70 family)
MGHLRHACRSMRTGGLETDSDAVLARALIEGDEAALAGIYDRFMPGIYDFLGRFLHDRFAAEDLAQMTFVRAWEGRQTLREPEKVKSWLYTIAHNLATNHVTRTRRSEPIEDQYDLATAAPGPEDQVAAKELAELVWAAAASLEPRQYAILDLSVRRELATQTSTGSPSPGTQVPLAGVQNRSSGCQATRAGYVCSLAAVTA